MNNKVLPKSNEKGAKEVREERITKVFNLRMQGYSLREIGRLHGVSHVTIFNDIKARLNELHDQNLELAAQYRDMQIARMETVMAKLMPLIMGIEDDLDYKPDMVAIDKYIKIESDLAKLIGTRAPVRQEHEVTMPEPISYELALEDDDHDKEN